MLGTVSCKYFFKIFMVSEMLHSLPLLLQPIGNCIDKDKEQFPCKGSGLVHGLDDSLGWNDV